MTQAEFQFRKELQGPVNKLLHGHNLSPDSSAYNIAEHLSNLKWKLENAAKKLWQDNSAVTIKHDKRHPIKKINVSG